MYHYQNAVVKDKQSAGRWVQANLINSSVAGLFNTYSEVFLIVTHPSVENLLAVNLKDVSVEISSLMDSVTVGQWLQGRGDLSLPTSNDIPTVTAKQVRCNDAFYAKYKIELVNREYSNDSELFDTAKHDLWLSKKGMDYEALYRNCLFTVNGLVHPTDYDPAGLYIFQGGRSGYVANQNHAGLLNFGDIGKMKYIALTDEMIDNHNPLGKLENEAYITLNEDIGHRVVMLSIGGYLHMANNCFRQTGERTIKIEFNKLPYVDRFFCSRKLIDMKAVEDTMDRDADNPDHFSVAQLFSDKTIRTYLTLPQTFVILLEADNLYVDKHVAEYTALPGRYYSHGRPQWPLMTELGRLPEYLAWEEDGLYVVAVQDNNRTNFRYVTTEWKLERTIDPQRDSVHPFNYAKGFFLEIGSDVMTTVHNSTIPVPVP